jgi:alpha-mannosidase
MIERFCAEVEFARRLARVEGPASAGWEALIAAAEERFQAAQGGSQEEIETALADAEGILAPIGAVAKTYTIHCVGHGHIDMNWMWGWPETVAVTNDTFSTVLRLMDEFPDFCYTQSQCSVYEIARKYNPELFERIKQRVAEGRWEVAAVHWVEGDKNLASGESLARHLLYSRRFVAEHFGLKPEDVRVDWEPDTFGHAITLPTILSRAGVTRYYMCRGGREQRPPVFWWEGPDGSRVLVYKDIRWYNSALEPASTEGLLEFREKTGFKDWMQMYGVGDHGGGPTRRDICRAIEMNAWPIYPNFRFATTDAYYRLLEADGDRIPTVKQELNFEFTGCYTSQSHIKRANRYGENACGEAEAAAALALRALGRPYPSEMLREAWRDVLFNHFHDILPGSGVRDTRTYNQGQFQEVIAKTSMVKTNSLRALAGVIDTSFAGRVELPEVPALRSPKGLGGGAGRNTMSGAISLLGESNGGTLPFVVFNPTAWAREDVVTVTAWDMSGEATTDDMTKTAFRVRRPDGSVVAAQKIRTGEYWGHHFADLAFKAAVGPMGYSTYVVEVGEAEPETNGTRNIVEADGGEGINNPVGAFVLENEFLRVEFDRFTGGICGLTDKRTGARIADPGRPMGTLEYFLERPHGGTAWIIGDTQEHIYPVTVEGFGISGAGEWGVRPESNGPVVSKAVARVLVGNSRFEVTYLLKAGQPWVEVHVEGTWLERGGKDIGVPRLAMRFPTCIQAKSARYEIPYGSIERASGGGREVPAQRWADVSGTVPGGGRAGFAVLNDCKYGHSWGDGVLRVNLIRSTYDPDPLPEISDHSMKFAIVPHSGDVPASELARWGAAFNLPLQVVSTDVHGGELPARHESVVACSAPNVLVTQVKKAEDEEALVFRLVEMDGEATTADVSIDTKLLGKAVRAVEVDLLERPVAGGQAEVTAEGFRVAVPAHGVASVMVWM